MLQILERFPAITTLVKHAPLQIVTSHVTRSHVFPWTGSNCSLIDDTFYFLNNDDGRHLHHRKCEVSLKESLKPQNITKDKFEALVCKSELPSAQTNKAESEINRSGSMDTNVTLTYILVTTNAIVTGIGHVVLDDAKLVPKSCPTEHSYSATSGDPSYLESYPLYGEVFVISQVWNGYFHIVVDQLTRLAPYFWFLRRNPSIFIHMNIRPDMFNVTEEYFEMLGMNSSRLITGVVRAQVVYVPAGSPCADPPLFQTRLLSLLLRHRIRFPPDKRTTVVLIKRKEGWRRWFKHHNGIKQKLHSLTRSNMKLVLEELTDPVPPLQQVAMTMNRATVIVGPHGAGLSNMLFSEPGTVVIEGMCRVELTALCFRNLAYTLGHRYYGVLHEKPCLDITPSNLVEPVRFYVNVTSQRKAKKKIIMHYPAGNPLFQSSIFNVHS